MLKSDLIKKVSKMRSHLSYKDAEQIVDIIFEQMKNSLTKEERIEIRGFGAFSIRKRKPKNARNPKTGEKIKVGERASIYFRGGKEMFEKCNQS